MSARDAVHAYLRHTGGDTLSGIWNGLRRQYSQPEIRKALRELAPDPLKVGDWPAANASALDRDRFRHLFRAAMSRTDYPEPFTLYRLPAEAAR